MQLVLDSNEYLFAFGIERKPACEALFDALLEASARYRLRISRTILEEVRRNAAPQRFRDFWLFLQALGVIVDEDWEAANIFLRSRTRAPIKYSTRFAITPKCSRPRNSRLLAMLFTLLPAPNLPGVGVAVNGGF